ncbi:MAG: calcium-binding protein [Leptolyngbyaceae cyanobacterium SM1_3_5]|nr:calcium-binding protein [Leptolyngbyaceae cyanobacterium SM1_3_5]
MGVFTGDNDNNELRGTDGDDTISGLGGNDLLDGRGGNDFLVGGEGDDVFVVDSQFDTVFELFNGGEDSVASFISFNLERTPDVENATLAAPNGNLNLKGNALNNVLIGNAGNNTIEGLAGDDSLRGGAGNDMLDGGTGRDLMQGGEGDDLFYVDTPLDRVVENPGQGNDVVVTTVSYALPANIERLAISARFDNTTPVDGTGNELDNLIVANNAQNTLRGLAGNDELRGNGGNDTLDGGVGSDRMEGGEGDDTFIVDDAEDVVVESANQGNDLVVSSISYTLGDNLERLTLQPDGTTPIDGTGNELDNKLIGNNAANTLRGLAGNDTLNGGAGTDQLEGGLGNDLYIITNASDVVTEAANAGTDTVQASVSYVLGANVENLTLTGAGNRNGTGNALNNVLTGNAGNNILNGRGGTDTLKGGLGNDTYIIGDATDVAIEAARAGLDTVKASVSYALRANVENLTLTGSGNTRGIGNGANNILIGNAGVNVLNGAAGNDILFSGAGRDVMVGGAGADSFVLSAPRSGIDRIQDFNKEQGDKLIVDLDVFPGLRTGRLLPNQFVKGTQALDQNDRFVYNERNGALFYDVDGKGGVGQVQIATLVGNPDLAATDIFAVASPF